MLFFKKNHWINTCPIPCCIVDKHAKLLKNNNDFNIHFNFNNLLEFSKIISTDFYINIEKTLINKTNFKNTFEYISNSKNSIDINNISPRLNHIFHEIYEKKLSNIYTKTYELIINPYKNNFVCYFNDISSHINNEKLLIKVASEQDNLLNNIYPKHIIESLHSTGNLNTLAANHQCVSILFCDIVQFTNLSKQISPFQVMNLLNNIFSFFDKLNNTYKVFKLETVGDCYVAVCGLGEKDEYGSLKCSFEKSRNYSRDAINLYTFAKHCISTIFHSPINNQPIKLRIGIHTGPVYSGIIGTKMPKYCLFGDTMNCASRMESTATPGQIQISEKTYNLLDSYTKLELVKNENVEIKGKGTMNTYSYNPDVNQNYNIINMLTSFEKSSKIGSVSDPLFKIQNE
jgi:class 3 adenylate cyclase